jgi:hypothetical protein
VPFSSTSFISSPLSTTTLAYFPVSCPRDTCHQQTRFDHFQQNETGIVRRSPPAIHPVAAKRRDEFRVVQQRAPGARARVVLAAVVVRTVVVGTLAQVRGGQRYFGRYPSSRSKLAHKAVSIIVSIAWASGAAAVRVPSCAAAPFDARNRLQVCGDCVGAGYASPDMRWISNYCGVKISVNSFVPAGPVSSIYRAVAWFYRNAKSQRGNTGSHSHPYL